MFVLDTNTVLHYFKGKGRVTERLLAKPPAEIALPAIALYEVWVGASARATSNLAKTSWRNSLRQLPSREDR